MTAYKEIIKTIHTLKAENAKLSKADIIKILNATKAITPHKDIIDTLLFFLKAYPSHINPNTVLTKRELEVLQHIGNGKTSAKIASHLRLSIATVETHRKNIRKKLKLVGKGKLIEFAILYCLKQHS